MIRFSQEERQEIALCYLPCFMADRMEPFQIQTIGYSIFTEPAKSKSCNRFLKWNTAQIDYVIEYAIFFDFDIQHLYDLEHVFVYIGYDGTIKDIELSFHGKFIRGMIENITRFVEDSHPIIYMQPGKHAMMADPSYFELCIQRTEACKEMAGEDGFLIAPMFEEVFATNEEVDNHVKNYIKENYSFIPTMCFEKSTIQNEQVVSYDKLEEIIIERMNMWKQRILHFYSE